jgi:anti-anti-sigma factor
MMQVQAQRLTNGVTKIDLAGRLDNAGVQGMDSQFNAVTTAQNAAVIVDLSNVTFLASIGIRALIIKARAIRQSGGKMVLLKPKPLVDEVLTAAGIPTIIDTLDDLDSAYAALGAPSAAS